MANTYLTPDIIAKEALVIAKNEMTALSVVDRQHSQEFENKVGDTIRIRKRVRYDAVNGPDVTGQLRDTIEGSTSLVLDQYRSVPIEVSSTELTLDVKDFSKIHIEPAMVELVQQAESSITDLYKQVYWFAGTAGAGLKTFKEFNQPREILTKAGVPMNDRVSLLDPSALTDLSDELKNVFQQEKVTTALERTRIGRYAMFDTYENVSLQAHTVGDYTGTPLVDGAAQDVTYDSVKDTNTQTLNTKDWGLSIDPLLNEGDVFTIDGVFAVNPKTRTSTGKLQTFTVRSGAVSDGTGNSAISISPAIITSGAYQTVTAAPADNASISVVSGAAGTSNIQNLFMHKDAFTIAFANLAAPMGGAKSARETYESVSVRVVMDFDVLTDKNIIRFDILYGVLAQNPQFACRYTQ